MKIRKLIFISALFLVLTLLFSCSSVQSESAETTEAETAAADTTNETIRETAAETEKAEFDGEIPEEYSFINTDVPQIIITCDDNLRREYSPASITVITFESDELDILSDEDCQIRIRGNSSSSTAKLSFNIKFSEKQPLLSMGSGKKWSLLANPFDKTLIRCKLISDLSQKMELPYASESEYAEVWLNGRFMGNYLVIEPVEEGKNRVDIDVTENEFVLERNCVREEWGVSYFTTPLLGYRFEINEPSEPTDEQKTFLEDFFTAAETAILSHDHTQYEEYIDVDSFVDYYILYEVAKDIDFAEYSTRYFIKDGKLYGGPPWDFDLTMGNVSYCEDKYLAYHNVGEFGDGEDSDDSTEGFWTRRDWYSELFLDDWFRERVSDRYFELRDTLYNLCSGDGNQIDLLVNIYSDTFHRNYSVGKWLIGAPYGPYENQDPPLTYEKNIEQLRSWIIKRLGWLDEHIADPDVPTDMY